MKENFNMIIEKYDNYKDLIPFYISRGLEFEDDFDNKSVFSLILKNNDEMIGAATYTKMNEDYIIEAIAITENETKKGYGKQLLTKVLNEIKLLNGTDIYLVAKEPIFFKKNGFIEIDESKAPSFSCCFMCPDYKITCFPIVMKYTNGKEI